METPCVGICSFDPETGLCEGCGRSVAQIAAWASMTPAERRSIMNAIDDFRLVADAVAR